MPKPVHVVGKEVVPAKLNLAGFETSYQRTITFLANQILDDLHYENVSRVQWNSILISIIPVLISKGAETNIYGSVTDRILPLVFVIIFASPFSVLFVAFMLFFIFRIDTGVSLIWV